MKQPYRIVISGEGGQGVLSIAKIIATAAWMQGRTATYMPFFGTEKRGGISIGYAQIGEEPITVPKFEKADLCVALSQRAVARLMRYLKDDSVIVVNSFLVKDLTDIAKWKPHSIDAASIAREQLKKPRTFNMVIMGAMLKHIPGMSEEGFEKALEKAFKSKYEKDPALRELNAKAVSIGYQLG